MKQPLIPNNVEIMSQDSDIIDNYNDELKQNLKLISFLLERAEIDFKNDMNELKMQMKCLNELMCLDETLLLKYVIIKRLNLLNDLFCLNKKLIFHSSNKSMSPLNYSNDYEQFDMFEREFFLKESHHSRLKLIIESEASLQQENVPNESMRMMRVFQFEKKVQSNKSDKCQKLKCNDKGNVKKVSSNIYSKLATKRSCSADYNNQHRSITKINTRQSRRSHSRQQKNTIPLSSSSPITSSSSSVSSNDSLENESTSEEDNDESTLNSYLCETSFELNRTQKSLHTIDLKKLCNKLIIITYKLISLETTLHQSHGIPIKCEYYKVDQEKRQFISKNTNPQYLFEIPPSSIVPIQNSTNNVFKRMFQKRSKSTSILKQHDEPSSSVLNLNLTNIKVTCFDDLFTDTVPNLNAWTHNVGLESNANLKIYLKKLQHQDVEIRQENFNFYQLRLTATKSGAMRSSSFFKVNRKIFDIITFEILNDDEIIQFDLYRIDLKKRIELKIDSIHLDCLSLNVQRRILNFNNSYNLKFSFSFREQLKPNLTSLVECLGKYRLSDCNRLFFESIECLNKLNDNEIDNINVVTRRMIGQTIFAQLKHSFNSSRFEALLKACIRISTCDLSLKYEINDLITKLTASKQKDLNLKLKFLDLLPVHIFHAQDLYSLCMRIYLSGHFNYASLFELNVFNDNYQFRNRIVEFLLVNYLNGVNDVGDEEINLVMSILRFKLKLDKSNVDKLIHRTLKRIIGCLEKRFDANRFLCLIELLETILGSNHATSFYLDRFRLEDVRQLFRIIIVYLNCFSTKKGEEISNENGERFVIYRKRVLLTSSVTRDEYGIDLRRHQLWLNVNAIILRFSKQIQKYLLRFLINAPESNSEHDNLTCQNLLQSYFEMIFSFTNQPNQMEINSLVTLEMKYDILTSLCTFWTSNFNVTLKRCQLLNELLLKRLLECLTKNMYFQVARFKENIFEIKFTNRKQIYLFNEIVFKFLSELFINTLDFKAYYNALFLNLMQIFISNENSKKKIGAFSQLDEHGQLSFFSTGCKIILEMLDEIFKVTRRENYTRHAPKEHDELLFGNKEHRNELLILFTQCLEYHLLKEEYECGSDSDSDDNTTDSNYVTQIEKFIFIYDLIKMVSKVNVEERFFTSEYFTFLNDTKRTIKMHLLDDLYHLHKYEKNYLQMSFIRKEQADLLEWNGQKKNESDLKEILYLKSLKKFAINSLHEKFLMQETAYLNEYYKSLENQQQNIDTNKTSLIDGANDMASIQFEICKELCSYYEKFNENQCKFNRILNVESKFLHLASSSAASSTPQQTNESQTKTNSSPLPNLPKSNAAHHGHLYFRVGFFGSSLKFESIRNKYFVYKHHTYEMLSNIQHLILNKLTYAKWSANLLLDDTFLLKSVHNQVILLSHNQELDINLKENKDDKCYIQICALNKMEKSKLEELIEESDKFINESRLKALKCEHLYYFDRPFYLKSAEIISHSSSSNLAVDEQDRYDDDCEIENLWVERSVLLVDNCETSSLLIENNLSQYDEVKCTLKLLLNPVRNAISDIDEKTKELKHFIVQFTANQNLNNLNVNVMHSLQPLTMRLLGCLDARVNGGLIKYVRELLAHPRENLTWSKLSNARARKSLFNQLHSSIRNQLSILESGLSIHDRILKRLNESRQLLQQVAMINENATSSAGQTNINELNLNSSFDHMNELNVHLIKCLKLIENELNERWSKFSF